MPTNLTAPAAPDAGAAAQEAASAIDFAARFGSEVIDVIEVIASNGLATTVVGVLIIVALLRGAWSRSARRY